MPDFELPRRIRGDLSDEYFWTVGMLVHTVTLLEVRVENLARGFGAPTTKRLKRMQFAEPTNFCLECAEQCDEPLRSDLLGYLGDVAKVRKYRHAVVHSKAPKEGFAWRFLRGEDSSLGNHAVLFTTSIQEMQANILESFGLILAGEQLEARLAD